MEYIFGTGTGTGWTLVNAVEFDGPTGSPWYNVTISRTGSFNADTAVRIAANAQDFELEGAEIIADDPIETIIFGEPPAPVLGAGTFTCSLPAGMYGEFSDPDDAPALALSVEPATPWLTLDYLWAVPGALQSACWVPTQLVSLDGGAGSAWEVRTKVLHRTDPAADINCFVENAYQLISYLDLPLQTSSNSFPEPYCYMMYSDTAAPNSVEFSVTSAPTHHEGSGATVEIQANFTHSLRRDDGVTYFPSLFTDLFTDSVSGGYWTMNQADVTRDPADDNTFHFKLELANVNTLVELVAIPSNIEKSTTLTGQGGVTLLSLPYQAPSNTGGGGGGGNTFITDGRATFDCSNVPTTFGAYNDDSITYDVPIELEPAFPEFSLNYIAQTHNCFNVKDLVNNDGGVGRDWLLKVNFESALTQPTSCSQMEGYQLVYFNGPHASTSSAANSPSCTAMYDATVAQNHIQIAEVSGASHLSYDGSITTVELLVSFTYPLKDPVRASAASTDAGRDPQAVFSSSIFVNSSQVSPPVFEVYGSAPNTWRATYTVSTGVDTVAFTAIPGNVEGALFAGNDFIAKVVFTLSPTAQAVQDAAGGSTGGGNTGGGSTGGGSTGGGNTGGGSTSGVDGDGPAPGTQNGTDSGTSGGGASASGGSIDANQSSETNMGGGSVAAIVVCVAVAVGAAAIAIRSRAAKAKEVAALNGEKLPEVDTKSKLSNTDSAVAPSVTDALDDPEACDKTVNPVAKPQSPEQDKTTSSDARGGVDAPVQALDFDFTPGQAAGSQMGELGDVPQGEAVEGPSAEEISGVHEQPEDEASEMPADDAVEQDSQAVVSVEDDVETCPGVNASASDINIGAVELDSPAAEEDAPTAARTETGNASDAIEALPQDGSAEGATAAAAGEQFAVEEADSHENSKEAEDTPVAAEAIADWD